jgi:hypothetical protein
MGDIVANGVPLDFVSSGTQRGTTAINGDQPPGPLVHWSTFRMVPLAGPAFFGHLSDTRTEGARVSSGAFCIIMTLLDNLVAGIGFEPMTFRL